MAKRIPITSQEFLEKILVGERDFSRTSVKGDLSAHETYAEAIKLLRRPKESLLLRKAKMRINAPGFWFPRASFQYSDLSYSVLTRSYLRGADFSHASLVKTDLSLTDLRKADFFYADLYHAIFKGANLANGNYSHADLTKADLRNVTGLRHTKHLGYAHFDNTVVTREEATIIKEKLKRVYLSLQE